MEKKNSLWKGIAEQRTGAFVEWTEDGIPMCGDDKCDNFDGKRCKLIGFKPGNICEPIVAEMADRLTRE